jgi:prophage regulatory protein
MRLIDWKCLKTMVPFSRQHLARLEQPEKYGLRNVPFPKRVQIGQCRVAWLLTEVEAWIEARVANR